MSDPDRAGTPVGPDAPGPARPSGPAVGESAGAGLAEIPSGRLVPPGPLASPGLDHPVVAARRYKELLGESDAVRARLAEQLLARREGHDVVARRHSAAAEDIRSRVAGVWAQVSGPLAQHGLGDLDQLRPPSGKGPDLAAVYQRYAGDLEGLGRRPGPAGRPPDAAAGRRALRGSKERAERGSADISGMSGRSGAPGRGPSLSKGRDTRGRTGAPGDLIGPDGLVDPAVAKKLAYRLCLEVMGRAAELRAVSRGSSALSVGLVTALCCALAGALTVAARVFLDAPALPCLAAAGGVGALAVVAGTDSTAAAVVRSALLAAASAAMAVLATFRFVPIEPAGVIASLACLALALRFGLGFGSGPAKPAGQGSGRR